jgi:hypothetical protein
VGTIQAALPGTDQIDIFKPLTLQFRGLFVQNLLGGPPIDHAVLRGHEKCPLCFVTA